MEKIKKNINKIIIAIVLIFLATFIFNYVKKDETEDVVEVVIGGKDKTAQKILETLNELEKINPDYGFFTERISESDNAISFFQLIDFSEKELPEKDYGKNNPFLENSAPFISETSKVTVLEPVSPEGATNPTVSEGAGADVFESGTEQ